MQFTFNGLKYEGRIDHIKGIDAIIEKCENLGSADPADVKELQDTIQKREAKVKALTNTVAGLKEERTAAIARADKKDLEIAGLRKELKKLKK